MTEQEVQCLTGGLAKREVVGQRFGLSINMSGSDHVMLQVHGEGNVDIRNGAVVHLLLSAP